MCPMMKINFAYKSIFKVITFSTCTEESKKKSIDETIYRNNIYSLILTNIFNGVDILKGNIFFVLWSNNLCM